MRRDGSQLRGEARGYRLALQEGAAVDGAEGARARTHQHVVQVAVAEPRQPRVQRHARQRRHVLPLRRQEVRRVRAAPGERAPAPDTISYSTHTRWTPSTPLYQPSSQHSLLY